MVLPTPLLNIASSNLPGLQPNKNHSIFQLWQGSGLCSSVGLCHKCCLPWPCCLPCLPPSYPSHSTDISTVHRDWQCVRKRRLAGENHFLKSLELLKFKFLGKGQYVCNDPRLISLHRLNARQSCYRICPSLVGPSLLRPVSYFPSGLEGSHLIRTVSSTIFSF